MNNNLNERLLRYVKRTLSDANSRKLLTIDFFDTDMDFANPSVEDWGKLVAPEPVNAYSAIDLRIKNCDLVIRAMMELEIPYEKAASTLETAKVTLFPAIRNRAMRYSYFKNIDDLLDSFHAQFYRNTRCEKGLVGYGRWLPTLAALVFFWFGFEVEDLTVIKRKELIFSNGEVAVPFRGGYRTLSHPRVVKIIDEYAHSDGYLADHISGGYRFFQYVAAEELFRSSRQVMSRIGILNTLAQLKKEDSQVVKAGTYEPRLYIMSTVAMSAKFLMAYRTVCIPEHINPLRGLSPDERILLANTMTDKQHSVWWDVNAASLFTEWVRCFYPNAESETQTWM